MYFDSWDVAPVVFKYISDCVFWVGALSSFHLVMNWLGLKYINGELARVSHESLLQDLDEGVLILEEKSTLLQFVNKAA